nr:enoyl-CoA hydratase-related protein [Cupriavidus sp. SW-Y-13]
MLADLVVLSRVVGISTALEWCFTGRVFGAQEALERGLVRSIHRPEDLLPAAYLSTIAREIAGNASPVSVALARRIIWRMAGAAHPMEAHKLDSRAIQSRGPSEDAKEGIASFLEKRPANSLDSVSVDLPDFFNERTGLRATRVSGGGEGVFRNAPLRKLPTCFVESSRSGVTLLPWQFAAIIKADCRSKHAYDLF